VEAGARQEALREFLSLIEGRDLLLTHADKQIRQLQRKLAEKQARFVTPHYSWCGCGTRGCFRLRNDLYCVEWGVKLYSLTPGLSQNAGPLQICESTL